MAENGIIRANGKTEKAMKAMRLVWLIGAMLGLAGISAHAAPNPWEKPAADLADQIAAILGPGQTHLTIHNLSSISANEIPAIRRLLAQDLKAHGISLAGAESASSIRVTLSQDWRDGLWVAEIVEGNTTQVVMVEAGLTRVPSAGLNTQDRMTLRRQLVWATDESIPPPTGPASIEDRSLAALDLNEQVVVLTEQGVAIYLAGSRGWSFERQFPFPARNSIPRDPRGILIPSADGSGFTAFTAGLECVGSYRSPTDPAAKPSDGWMVQCHTSDDPWPITQPAIAQATGVHGSAAPTSATEARRPSLSAFYNAARDYFTGVVTPSIGVDLPPFYSAGLIPRAGSSVALLFGGIDGKVQLVENNALHPVAGTRDWGSDFAVLNSGCGSGTQIIVSGSGEATSDSLRAYEPPALEAIPASAPMAMDGTVMALWTAPDGKSVLAVARNAANQYEVDRVTALCN